MISLGLDPSLRSFGWALVNTSLKGQSRRVDSGHESTLSSTCQPARYLHLQQLVRDLINKYQKIDVIGIESPAYSAGPFQSIHHSLMMFSLAEIFLARKDCVLFDPSTREYLIRNGKKGKLNKSDVQRFVQLDTMDPISLQNDEADAYVIGFFAARFLELRRGLIKPQDLSPAEAQKFLYMTKQKKTPIGKRLIKTAHLFRENKRFFDFSRVPFGTITLPERSEMNPDILKYVENETM